LHEFPEEKRMHVRLDQDDAFLNTTVDNNYLGIPVIGLQRISYSADDEVLKPSLTDIVKCLYR